ncbi:MAG: P-loop NTPase [Acutalibacteraceae bacterium]|jgi:Mrp family chromosome partitioning ATPase
MTQSCNNNCESCGSDCADRQKAQNDFTAPAHEMSNIKKVIGVVSGKGGVGKSMITSLLAVTMNRLAYKTAVLDADVTGPSIPKAFGLKEKAQGNELGLFPVRSKTGVEIMSVNLLLKKETDPVVWRGPIIANTVKQFWTEVVWGDVDFMFIDMPPGTGDVALTVFQSVPVDGIIIVTSPQELVSMIVSKAVKMAEMMNIPVLGIVENMSYFKAPDTGTEYKIFGDSHLEETAEKHGLEILAKIPVEPKLSAACDKGLIELFEGAWLEPLGKTLENLL